VLKFTEKSGLIGTFFPSVIPTAERGYTGTVVSCINMETEILCTD
jgi:hypothetical protein